MLFKVGGYGDSARGRASDAAVVGGSGSGDGGAAGAGSEVGEAHVGGTGALQVRLLPTGLADPVVFKSTDLNCSGRGAVRVLVQALRVLVQALRVLVQPQVPRVCLNARALTHAPRWLGRRLLRS